MTTSYTYQPKSAVGTSTYQTKTATSYAFDSKNLGFSHLLKEDLGYLLTESGLLIALEQSTSGANWTMQPIS